MLDEPLRQSVPLHQPCQSLARDGSLSSSLSANPALMSTHPPTPLTNWRPACWAGGPAKPTHPSQRALSPVRLAGRRALFGWMEGLSCPAARPRGERFPSPQGERQKTWVKVTHADGERLERGIEGVPGAGGASARRIGKWTVAGEGTW